MTDTNDAVRLIEDGLSHLIGRPEPITYSELNAVLGNRFDLSSDEGRFAFGRVLSCITDRLREERPDTRHFMISALVHTKGGDPGAGFYKLATELGLLKTGASDFDRMEFWIGQVKAIKEYYGAS